MTVRNASPDVEALLAGVQKLTAGDRALFTALLLDQLDADLKDLPQWQRDEAREALEEYRRSPHDVVSWEEFRQELEADDAAGIDGK